MLDTQAADLEARTDMTPMIDCVFLMIVFFVCVDFRSLEAKLPAYLPKDRGSSRAVVAPSPELEVRVLAQQSGVRRYPGGDGVDAATRRPRRYVVEGHGVRWLVGPSPVTDRRELAAQLQRVHDDRSTWQEDAQHPGRLVPPHVVIAPQAGVVYDDVAATADALRAAGYAEIHFGP